MEEKLVFMWGYLPGALPQRAPILSSVVVRLPQGENAWKDVCGGGCGFAMAISDSGKLITWGSTDDLGQSYVTSGNHGEMPEPFPLPAEVIIAKAAAGWAHCVSVTDMSSSRRRNSSSSQTVPETPEMPVETPETPMGETGSSAPSRGVPARAAFWLGPDAGLHGSLQPPS